MRCWLMKAWPVASDGFARVVVEIVIGDPLEKEKLQL